jgi:uncharacterized protein (DUF1501 family)
MTWTRRAVLASLAATAASLGAARVSFASAPTDRRLVLVILRGGMDGLTAIVPHGDPEYSRARGRMTVDSPLDLDGTFGLHPALAPLMPLYEAGELAPLHAVGLPFYEGRSHFDAQNVLENGTPVPNGARDGWLNRALVGLGGSALAVGKGVPLVLRGDVPIASIDPGSSADPQEDFLDAVAALYREDKQLADALTDGRMTRELVMMDAAPSGGRRRGRANALPRAVQAVKAALSAPDAPAITVLEAGGWDTHARQGGDTGGLATRLEGLTAGLVGIKEALGASWDRSAVLVVTEFGRTVRSNGTGGTDHGKGGVALLLGGAVSGGRVVTDWPGLSERARYEGRDLFPTTDLRAVFKGVLRDHLGIPASALHGTVFPDSAAVAPLDGLIG